MDELKIFPLSSKEIKWLKGFFPYVFVIMVTVIAVLSLISFADDHMPTAKKIGYVPMSTQKNAVDLSFLEEAYTGFVPGGDPNNAYCEGNFDCNQNVDGLDLYTFKQEYGRNAYYNPCTAQNPCKADFNCDDAVDGIDAAIIKADFGRSKFNKSCPLSPVIKTYPECNVGVQQCHKSCSNNTDCFTGTYCKKPVGQCAVAGTCEITPNNCTQVYDPVCGCDNKNYANSCVAATQGVSVAHLGVCRLSTCTSDADCDDNNPNDCIQRVCINQGTLNATCVERQLSCGSNCGANSACTYSGSCELKIPNGSSIACECDGQCQSGICFNHQCGPKLSCSGNADCNDDNLCTTDYCFYPGASNSFCSNTHLGCGTYCSVENTGMRCNENALCEYVKSAGGQCDCNKQCQSGPCCNNVCCASGQMCLNGNCVYSVCKNPGDCFDGNACTFDNCINPGTQNAYCTHEPEECGIPCGVSGTAVCDASGICHFGETVICN